MKSMMRFIGRLLGRFVGLVAWVIMILGFLLGYWFFYAEDRLLFIFPGLADKVTLTELMNQPDAYDDRWVRVRGVLWRKKLNSAVLVPPESGQESWTKEEFRELLAKTEKGKKIPSIKPLPEIRLSMLSPGWKARRTVSFYLDGPVTAMGEFERPGMLDDRPRLYVGGIQEQRGDFWTWFGIALHGAIYSVIMAFGFTLLYIKRSVAKDLIVRPGDKS
jgi:hypothetical protein